MHRLSLFPFCALLLLIGCTSEEETTVVNAPVSDPIALVNPFVGTGGHGHTYPGASVPFGMMQLSPDTRLEGWDGCSGYHNSDSIVYGFSHTHLSGTGVPDYGDLLLMPMVQQAQFDPKENALSYASSFLKTSEVASPGYYEVTLEDGKIDVRLTVAERAGLHEYSFQPQDSGYVLIDLAHRDQLLDVDLQQLDASTFTGKRISNAWASEQHFYFHMQFSRPAVNTVWQMNKDGKPLKAIVSFAPSTKPLHVKVGMSAVDVAGAEKNLMAAIPAFDFNTTHLQAISMWDKELRKIEISGGTKDEQTLFYTGLYHSFLSPNLFSDEDGRYRGMDGTVHQVPEGEKQYTVFSLWDTFRGTHPLFTITQRERTAEFLRTFERQYKDGSKLPIWELAGNYTGCMIGYHAIPVIADAHVKGISDFDEKLLLEAMVHSANTDELGLPSYRALGYIPAGVEAESVSKTLEYAYDDWCIAVYAERLGEDSIAQVFYDRAMSYKNLFDPETGFLRAKMSGSWFAPFDPSEVNYNYTEANAWQYSLFVPHDVSGLAELMDGFSGMEEHLDAMFVATSQTTGREQADITGLIGQYAQGNEPSHHMAYLYNYTGSPWKTQERVAQIMDELYTNAPDGLSGNEDCGQMSSWYVLSSLGFYPVTPGSTIYAIGSPLFSRASIQLENGNAFTVLSEGDGPYIQSATLNGVEYNKSFLEHEAIMAGGELAFVMGNVPNKNWGVGEAATPVAAMQKARRLPVPFFRATGTTFIDSLLVELGSPTGDKGDISYTIQLEGSVESPSLSYTKPIVLNSSCTICATYFEDGKSSTPICETYFKIDGGKSIVLETEFANQYSAGGEDALIDYLRGSNNYRTGRWQGFQENDLVAIIDVGESREYSTIKMGFLQDIKSWIFYPKSVELSGSNDGITFQEIGIKKNTFSDSTHGAFTQDFIWKSKKAYRYYRVKAVNYGECPEWHLGAGGKTWLFADEVVFE